MWKKRQPMLGLIISSLFSVSLLLTPSLILGQIGGPGEGHDGGGDGGVIPKVYQIRTGTEIGPLPPELYVHILGDPNATYFCRITKLGLHGGVQTFWLDPVPLPVGVFDRWYAAFDAGESFVEPGHPGKFRSGSYLIEYYEDGELEPFYAATFEIRSHLDPYYAERSSWLMQMSYDTVAPVLGERFVRFTARVPAHEIATTKVRIYYLVPPPFGFGDPIPFFVDELDLQSHPVPHADFEPTEGGQYIARLGQDDVTHDSGNFHVQ